MQARQIAGLVLEARPETKIHRQLAHEDLDGDVSAQMLGVGAVDRGHASATDNFPELVFVVLEGPPDEAIGTHRRGLRSVGASLSSVIASLRSVTAASTRRTSVASARCCVRIPLGSVASPLSSVAAPLCSVAAPPDSVTAARLVRSISASTRVVASDDVVAIVASSPTHTTDSMAGRTLTNNVDRTANSKRSKAA